MRKLQNSELNRLSVEEYKQVKKIPVVIVLDNIRSLNNVGSIFRTCDAFKIQSIYLCGITGKPPHKEIHKTALGATDSVPWQYFEDTGEALGELKTNNYKILGVEQVEGSSSLCSYALDKQTKYAIVFGHEVKGVQQSVVDLCDECIEIPQYGTKHSLNISISAGIVIWEFFRQLET